MNFFFEKLYSLWCLHIYKFWLLSQTIDNRLALNNTKTHFHTTKDILRLKTMTFYVTILQIYRKI